ncbi:MAG TPA: glycosyltransferase [Bryobacteraceae bacterium]|nr:glycosyltransferase [Bryobacteraceae bacterium]
MKILWVKTDFLHPTTRGGQIRTLEMLRELHKHHEVHYVAFDDPRNPEGFARSPEYSTCAYPIQHRVVSKRSPEFALQLAFGLFDAYPVAGTRYRSRPMRERISQLLKSHAFDAKICDFLAPSINIDSMDGWVLFQHNVETIIWERHAQTASTPLHRAYFHRQAKLMFNWEKAACNSASHVIAVSEVDRKIMRERFGSRSISAVGTGVDLDYFAAPQSKSRQFDFVFVGSMDWMPNVDGMEWFLSEVFPIIKASKPDARLAIVGRNPPPALLAKADQSNVTVTGTVADVRPFLWQSAISVVPLRVGGGTRLKIFEAMAAGTPVVATTIGAEGLPVEHGKTIQIADNPQTFASECLHLLNDSQQCLGISQAALEMVRANFSWERVTHDFEEILQAVEPSKARPAMNARRT